MIDDALVKASDYTGDPVGLGENLETIVETLGVVCRYLPVSPVPIHDTELDTLVMEAEDGYKVSNSVSAIADVSGF